MAFVTKLLRQRACCGLQFQRASSFFNRFCKKQKDDTVTEDECDEKSVTVQLESAFKLYNLNDEPETTVELTRNDAIKFYKQMQTIRRFENLCLALYQDKFIRGFLHLYMGQEACCVGAKASMRKFDTCASAYRIHGWCWLSGISLYSLLAEMMQRKAGCARGKGGSMHCYSENFYGGLAVVGSMGPVGTGISLAHAFRCDEAVNFVIYGDGAAPQGQIKEAYNIACLWKLPVVYLCENNRLGYATQVERSNCNVNIYMQGDLIPGIWVDGMDVLAVRSAVKYAIKYAHEIGPIIVELDTYRYSGHSMADDGSTYRTREDVQKVRESRDPIKRFSDLCVKNSMLTEEEMKKMDDKIREELDDITKRCKTEAEPGLEELTSDLYVKNLENNIRGVLGRNHKHLTLGQLFRPLGTPRATPASEITLLNATNQSQTPAQGAEAKGATEAKGAAAEDKTKSEKPNSETKK